MNNEIKGYKDLKEDGYYFMADKTDSGDQWEVVWVEADPHYDPTDPDNDMVSGLFYGESKYEANNDVEAYHVFVGPIPLPSVPVPFERLTETPAAAEVPALVVKKVIELTPPPPTLIKLKRPDHSEGGECD